MRKITSLLAAVLLLTACEKQIDIDIDDTESQVVVKATNEVDNPMSVDLTYSRPAFGSYYIRYSEDYFQKITDATVSMSINGGAEISATRNGGTYTFAHIPQPGEELSLSINIPGKDEVTATATVPQRPVISNLDTSYADNDYDYYPQMQLSISFTLDDQASTDDFYSIRLCEVDTFINIHRDNYGNTISTDTSVNNYYLYFNCTDYLLVSNTNIDLDDPTGTRTFSGTEMLFTDATINGMNHNIKISGYYDSYGGGDIYEKTSDSTIFRSGLRLEVTALSRDLYLYRQTMNSYSDDELLGFFSEPVQVHSNITGGIGIFGVSAKTTLPVPIRKVSYE